MDFDIKLGAQPEADAESPTEDYSEDATTEAAEKVMAAFEAKDATALVRTLRLLVPLLQDDLP